MKIRSRPLFIAGFLLYPALAPASNEGVGVQASRPSPSPVSSEIVFAADYEQSSSLSRLWICSLDGSNLRRAPTPPSSRAEEDPAWSPDGKAIAYSSFDGVTSDIWISIPDRVTMRLTSKALNNRQPNWSPDGKRIVFVSDRAGSNDIWVMNADGSDQRRVTTLPGQENHPSFSPDGKTIVFSQTVRGKASLSIVDAEGSNVRPLTAPGDVNDWNPSWGTAGVIFASNRDKTSEHWKIWIVQPNGSGLKKMSEVMALDPVWTKDGKILFTDETAPTRALADVALLDPSTGVKRIVTTVEGFLVPIDIRPGDPRNVIPRQLRGEISVAVLSSPKFDPLAAVDRPSLRFGRTGKEAAATRCDAGRRDVNGDGAPDLICRFDAAETGFGPGDRLGVLRFHDGEGTPFEGRDAIIVPGPE